MESGACSVLKAVTGLVVVLVLTAVLDTFFEATATAPLDSSNPETRDDPVFRKKAMLPCSVSLVLPVLLLLLLLLPQLLLLILLLALPGPSDLVFFSRKASMHPGTLPSKMHFFSCWAVSPLLLILIAEASGSGPGSGSVSEGKEDSWCRPEAEE
jgi:hypothetical protein